MVGGRRLDAGPGKRLLLLLLLLMLMLMLMLMLLLLLLLLLLLMLLLLPPLFSSVLGGTGARASHLEDARAESEPRRRGKAGPRHHFLDEVDGGGVGEEAREAHVSH